MVPTMNAPPVSATTTTFNMTTVLPPRPRFAVDVVDFDPEELNDLTPLKPEEADEVQLAAILQGNDLSFLFDVVTTGKRKIMEQSHRIPADSHVGFATNDNKRRRISA